MAQPTNSLASTKWLARKLDGDLVVLDASKHLPKAERDARAEFEAAHIPGARFFDLPSLVDQDAPIGNALPTRDQFAARMAALGVGPGDRVILYDDSALRSAARAWFIFRLMGMNVAVLDGGMEAWRADGLPIEGGAVATSPSTFAAPPPASN